MSSETDVGWSDPHELRAPLPLLVLAGLLVVVGVAGYFLGPAKLWSTIGYGCACIGAVSVIGLFRFADGRMRTRRGYRVTVGVDRICQAMLVLAWLVSIADAWRLATELSR